MKTILFILILLAALLTGCAGTGDRDTKAVYPVQTRKTADLSHTEKIKRILYSQFRGWRSVRYKAGGLSKKGIDCSGFVYITFLQKLGIRLPRTTELQAGIGPAVRKGRLRAGDLVFFKTGIKVRHVGIYIEDGKFLHASTSRGVTISSLDNSYWSDTYWKSVRIEI